MKIFISGGNKNGKSTIAQYLAKKMCKPGESLYYLATMIPTDHEDEARILRHRQEREGWGFETVEAGHNMLTAVGKCDERGSFLLDSVTALLANEMFAADGIVLEAHKKLASDLTKILNRIDNMVIVSDFIYSDAFLYDDWSEAYRRGLAYIDRQIAKVCDGVIEVCGGVAIVHKGGKSLGDMSVDIRNDVPIHIPGDVLREDAYELN